MAQLSSDERYPAEAAAPERPPHVLSVRRLLRQRNGVFVLSEDDPVDQVEPVAGETLHAALLRLFRALGLGEEALQDFLVRRVVLHKEDAVGRKTMSFAPAALGAPAVDFTLLALMRRGG